MKKINTHSFTIDWIGYLDGAIKADTPDLIIKRDDGGNLYANVGDLVFNIHPRVTLCVDVNERIEYPAGVYPVRWELTTYEIMQL